MAHRAVRCEAARDFGEVDGPLALVDLDGIAAAERDVRPALAGEVDEVALIAGSASGTRFGGADLGVIVGPDVVGKQSATQLVAGARLTA